ncbi:MAG: RtcB family protein [bacterium]
MITITKEMLKKISPVIWELPIGAVPGMLAPARIYATEQMLTDILADKTLAQLANITMLPGIIGTAQAMPDAHEGYGFPIGGVAATEFPSGVISPGGIGYDINCGVRLLRSNLNINDIKDKTELLAQKLYNWVPSGVGRGGSLKLSAKNLDAVLRTGINWPIKEGYGEQSDMHYTESFGCLSNADPDKVSKQAKERGYDQLGTLGSGNHFIEVDIIDEIYDEQAAGVFGLHKNQIVVLIHTGSRGLGHQIATDHIKIMTQIMQNYGITPPEKELTCVPFNSPEGKDYFDAMACGANYAWANRQMITWRVRQAFAEVFGKDNTDANLSLLYDVAHNIAKIENHQINGKQKTVIMHRKGATRAFGPGHPEIVEEYRATGQPVIIPGSMGTASYVLVGTQEGMNISFGSTCHGAGRRMSRTAAQKSINSYELKESLNKSGIQIQVESLKDLAEEAPQAYKNIDDVISVVQQAGIARPVARLRPCAVVKG